eukprot:336571-Prymnesium_polylepis.1
MRCPPLGGRAHACRTRSTPSTATPTVPGAKVSCVARGGAESGRVCATCRQGNGDRNRQKGCR